MAKTPLLSAAVGILAARGLPRPIVDTPNVELGKAVLSPDVQQLSGARAE